mmetsp:Transcript_66950/g.178997  ORF Transcript_66950/g.178997 Transcript_66950/m.178997 type:complete len:239 (-) Transcript_66950:88-804(-)
MPPSHDVLAELENVGAGRVKMRALKIAVLLAGICTMFVVDRFPISPSILMESSSYEWPFVWDAGTNLDPNGYDWMGAAYVGDTRGLKMPPSHDVFGELENVGADAQVVQYDDVMPFGSLPGGPLFNLANGNTAAFRLAPGEEHKKAIKHERLMQALARSYTDYDKKGGPISCTCDSSAAGDEEMEGIYKSVKPACELRCCICGTIRSSISTFRWSLSLEAQSLRFTVQLTTANVLTLV